MLIHWTFLFDIVKKKYKEINMYLICLWNRFCSSENYVILAWSFYLFILIFYFFQHFRLTWNSLRITLIHHPVLDFWQRFGIQMFMKMVIYVFQFYIHPWMIRTVENFPAKGGTLLRYVVVCFFLFYVHFGNSFKLVLTIFIQFG